MGKYTIFYMFENPRRGMQARNFTTNVPKILDLKSSCEQIFFRKLSLGAPEHDGNVVSKSTRNIAQIMKSRPLEVAVASKTTPG